MEDYRTRLKEYLELQGVKPSFFVEKMNFSNGLINKVIQQKTHLSFDKLIAIFEFFPDLNVRWLFSGVGDMKLEKVSDESGLKYVDKAEWYSERYLKVHYELLEAKSKISELETVIKYLEEKCV